MITVMLESGMDEKEEREGTGRGGNGKGGKGRAMW